MRRLLFAIICRCCQRVDQAFWSGDDEDGD